MHIAAGAGADGGRKQLSDWWGGDLRCLKRCPRRALPGLCVVPLVISKHVSLRAAWGALPARSEGFLRGERCAHGHALGPARDDVRLYCFSERPVGVCSPLPTQQRALMCRVCASLPQVCGHCDGAGDRAAVHACVVLALRRPILPRLTRPCPLRAARQWTSTLTLCAAARRWCRWSSWRPACATLMIRMMGTTDHCTTYTPAGGGEVGNAERRFGLSCWQADCSFWRRTSACCCSAAAAHARRAISGDTSTALDMRCATRGPNADT